jgi:hypothetical protein
MQDGNELSASEECGGPDALTPKAKTADHQIGTYNTQIYNKAKDSTGHHRQLSIH